MRTVGKPVDNRTSGMRRKRRQCFVPFCANQNRIRHSGNRAGGIGNRFASRHLHSRRIKNHRLPATLRHSGGKRSASARRGMFKNHHQNASRKTGRSFAAANLGFHRRSAFKQPPDRSGGQIIKIQIVTNIHAQIVSFFRPLRGIIRPPSRSGGL